MQLSIIIVNYNVRYFLEHCLRSVFTSCEGLEAEVFVVDNQSSDGSVDMVKAKFPQVVLIENWQNAGFARANNQAFDKAKGKYVLFLNPDTIVPEDCFRRCVAYMDTHPEAGALGCRLVDGKGQFLPESKRGFPSVPVSFFKISGLSGLFPKSAFFNRYHQGHLPEKEIHEVDVLVGCFMFCRKLVLDKTGSFDTDYFMYGEDIDLSYKIKKAGFANIYFPETTVIHYKGESTKKGSLNYVKMFYQAMIIFARKHFERSQKGLFVMILTLAIYLRGILAFVVNAFMRMKLPMLDALIILGSLWVTKNIWIHQVKIDTLYPNKMLIGFFMAYLIIWLGSIYFNGGYDKPYRASRILRGMLIGGMVSIAMYGLLSEQMRFSRGITVLSALLATLLILLSRVMLQAAGVKSVEPDDTRKPVVIVGTPEEESEVRYLLEKAYVQKQIAGAISPFEHKENFQLGVLSNLRNLCRIYRVSEVIFVQQQLSFKQIIEAIQACGPQLDYKIHSHGTDSIIGSNSKNTAGDLYTIEVIYAISSASSKRNKRVTDILVSLFFLFGSPLLFWFSTNKRRYFQHHVLVLEGDLTYVGYTDPQFPVLKPSLLSVYPLMENYTIPDDNCEHLNWLYARHYTAWQDLRIILEKWRTI